MNHPVPRPVSIVGSLLARQGNRGPPTSLLLEVCRVKFVGRTACHPLAQGNRSAYKSPMTPLFAALHYVALALGFAGVFYRGRSLSEVLSKTTAPLANVYFGDNLWGLASILWIATGLMRATGNYEKGLQFYMHSPWFWLKMGLFGVVFLLEIYPMVTLIKWRMAKKTESTAGDRPTLQRLATLNHLEMTLVLVIPFVASIMARGGI